MARERDRLSRSGRFSTAANYRTALNSFRAFRQGRDLRPAELTAELLSAYERWLLDRGISPNTTSSYMRALRAVYNRAVERGWTPQRSPFKRIYTGIEKTAKRTLGREMVGRLESLSLTTSAALRFARDLFIFSILACGMPFVDLAYLRKEQVSDGYLVYHRHKTGKRICLKLTPRMSQIIRTYSPAGVYLFPILDSPASSEEAHAQYRLALNRHNRHLKRLAREAGIPGRLTSYTSRYTWAGCAYEENVALGVISKGLGHSQARTTQVYIQEIDDRALERANRQVIRRLFGREGPPGKKKKMDNYAQELGSQKY